MKKMLSGLFVAVFALGSLSAVACPGDKAKDDKQMSSPAKPGRSALAPDAVSSKTRSQPALRSASVCKAVSCSAVDTRA